MKRGNPDARAVASSPLEVTANLSEWVNCPECGGSGYFAGTFRDIECFHCGGEGSWEIDPETCSDCKRVLDDGECPVCDAHLHPELLPENKHRWVA